MTQTLILVTTAVALLVYIGFAFSLARRGKIGLALALAFFPASGRFITLRLLGSYAYTIRWALFFTSFIIVFCALAHLKLSGKRLRTLRVFWRPIALVSWCWVAVPTAVDPATSSLVTGSLSLGWILTFLLIPRFADHSDIRSQVIYSYIISVSPLLIAVFIELLHSPSALYSANRLGWDYGNPCTIAQNIAPIAVFSLALVLSSTSRIAKLIWVSMAVIVLSLLYAR